MDIELENGVFELQGINNSNKGYISLWVSLKTFNNFNKDKFDNQKNSKSKNFDVV